MNHNYYASIDEITLRPLLEIDIEQVRCWRNNKDNCKYLKKIDYITPASQKKWYSSYLNNNDLITFAIIDNEIVHGIVGTVSIYNIKDGSAEVGKIMIGDSRAHNRKIGRKAMVLAMMVGFSYFNIESFYAFVDSNNTPAYKTYMSIGFTIEEEQFTDTGGKEFKIINTEKSIIDAGYTKDNMIIRIIK